MTTVRFATRISKRTHIELDYNGVRINSFPDYNDRSRDGEVYLTNSELTNLNEQHERFQLQFEAPR